MTDDLKPELRHELPKSWVRDRRGALVSELRRAERARRRRRSWRRGLMVVPAAALLAAGAFAVSLTRDTPTVATVNCYPRADREAAATASQDRIDDPVGSCLKEWRAGNVAPTTEAPPLVACIAADEVRVYPGRSEGVCARLGLDPLPERFGDIARKNQDFGERMARRLAGCPPVEHAKQIAREELDRAGRESWRVAVRPGQQGVERTDCIDSYGIVEIEGEPSRIELDYPVPGLSEAEARREEANIRRAICKDGAGDDVDAALAAAECRYDLLAHCIRPRLAANEVRRQLARRGIDMPVKTAFDAPDRCWSGFRNDGETLTILSHAR
jgi:hypothetical protein